MCRYACSEHSLRREFKLWSGTMILYGSIYHAVSKKRSLCSVNVVARRELWRESLVWGSSGCFTLANLNIDRSTNSSTSCPVLYQNHSHQSQTTIGILFTYQPFNDLKVCESALPSPLRQLSSSNVPNSSASMDSLGIGMDGDGIPTTERS